MKKLLILMIVILITLVGCSNELPPEPDAPGVAGNYFRQISDWVTEPYNADVDIEYSGNETYEFLIDVKDEFIYKYFYIWDEDASEWENGEFSENTVGDSPWISNSASFESLISTSDLKRAIDDDNEMFVVFYSCQKDNSGAWDCHNNKWQLNINKVAITSNKTCKDSDGGINYYEASYIATNYFEGRETCNGDNVIESYCNNESNLIATSYQCPFGCKDGACIRESLPDVPSTPGEVPVTHNKTPVNVTPGDIIQNLTPKNNSEFGEVYAKLNEPIKFESEDKIYTLEIIGGDDGKECITEITDSILLEVNGERYSALENDSINLDGLDIFVYDIFMTNIPNESVSAKIEINGEKYYIGFNESIYLNLSSGIVPLTIVDYSLGDCPEFVQKSKQVVIDVNGVRKTIREGDNTMINGLKIYVDDLFITNVPEDSVSANLLVFSNNDFEMIAEMNNNGKFKLDDNKSKFSFYVYDFSNGGGSFDDDMVMYGNVLRKNQLFILSDDYQSKVIKVNDIDLRDGEVELMDLSTLKEFSYDTDDEIDLSDTLFTGIRLKSIQKNGSDEEIILSKSVNNFFHLESLNIDLEFLPDKIIIDDGSVVVRIDSLDDDKIYSLETHDKETDCFYQSYDEQNICLVGKGYGVSITYDDFNIFKIV